MKIDYRTFDPDSQITTSAKGTGAYVLSRGEQFSIADPPGELTMVVENEIPTTYGSIRLFLAAGASEKSISTLASFDVDDLADLEGGRWLQASGTVTESPCG